jgi:hypothetical protein
VDVFALLWLGFIILAGASAALLILALFFTGRWAFGLVMLGTVAVGGILILVGMGQAGILSAESPEAARQAREAESAPPPVPPGTLVHEVRIPLPPGTTAEAAMAAVDRAMDPLAVQEALRAEEVADLLTVEAVLDAHEAHAEPGSDTTGAALRWTARYPADDPARETALAAVSGRLLETIRSGLRKPAEPSAPDAAPQNGLTD